MYNACMSALYDPRGLSVEERLLRHRRVRSSGCWEWTGARPPTLQGYGIMTVKEGSRFIARRVHRLAAAEWLGIDLDDSRCVLHHCDNPPCFNPEHLYIGTRLDNNRDRESRGRGRQVHGEGHPRAKITQDQVLELRRVANAGITQLELADRFGISQPQVSRILRRTSRFNE